MWNVGVSDTMTWEISVRVKYIRGFSHIYQDLIKLIRLFFCLKWLCLYFRHLLIILLVFNEVFLQCDFCFMWAYFCSCTLMQNEFRFISQTLDFDDIEYKGIRKTTHPFIRVVVLDEMVENKPSDEMRTIIFFFWMVTDIPAVCKEHQTSCFHFVFVFFPLTRTSWFWFVGDFLDPVKTLLYIIMNNEIRFRRDDLF